MYILQLIKCATVLTLLLVSSQSSAETFNPLTPSGNGSVDTPGFLSYFQTATDNLGTCGQFCKTQTVQPLNDCVIWCSRIQYKTNIGCWIKSCWNQVSIR